MSSAGKRNSPSVPSKALTKPSATKVTQTKQFKRKQPERRVTSLFSLSSLFESPEARFRRLQEVTKLITINELQKQGEYRAAEVLQKQLDQKHQHEDEEPQTSDDETEEPTE